MQKLLVGIWNINLWKYINYRDNWTYAIQYRIWSRYSYFIEFFWLISNCVVMHKSNGIKFCLMSLQSKDNYEEYT